MLKVYKDQPYEAVTLASRRSGKMWVGLGSLLTGGNVSNTFSYYFKWI